MTNNNLMTASNQWASRPADERFWTVSEARDAAQAWRDRAVQAKTPYASIRVEADGQDLYAIGSRGRKAVVSNFAFGQLSARVKAPPSYLRTLPPTVAAQCLNSGIKTREKTDDVASLLFHRNEDESLVLRAALSERYERVWNTDVLKRLEDLAGQGWQVPPARPSVSDPRARPATQADLLSIGQSSLGGLSIREGDMIAPGGVYVSDRDMFVFLVNERNTIQDPNGNVLGRGAFFWNSEVGEASLGLATFLYASVCGNHIVWGAQDLTEVRIRHIGEPAKAFRGVSAQLVRYANAGAGEVERQILESTTKVLGNSKEEILDAIFGTCRAKRIDLSQSTLSDALDVAEVRQDRYGDPRTAWALVNGLTEVSQREKHASDRAKLDRAAGRLATILF